MYSKLKLSQHKHTGRLRPHEHTSYLPLLVLVLFVGVILLQFSTATLAAASPGPAANSIGLSGIMPAKPPTIGAVITSPGNGQHFTTSPVTISGTCPTGTIVEIFKSDIFGGSTPCTTSGSFTLSVDLLFGSNTLIARVYDALNQAGPDSAAVTVFYDVTPPQSIPITSTNFSNRQILLETDAVYRGTFPGQTLNVPITILGGTPPFAVNVQWSDGSNTVIPHGDNTTFNASHIYSKPGTYEITIQASDSLQQVAFLQIAAIVNGQPVAANATSAGDENARTITNQLLVLWPLWAIILAVVVSFWLGEQREKHIRAIAQPPAPAAA